MMNTILRGLLLQSVSKFVERFIKSEILGFLFTLSKRLNRIIQCIVFIGTRLILALLSKHRPCLLSLENSAIEFFKTRFLLITLKNQYSSYIKHTFLDSIQKISNTYRNQSIPIFQFVFSQVFTKNYRINHLIFGT